MMDGELRELVDEIYFKVLQSTNKILHNCKTISIELLQLEDPSYEEMAKQLDKAAQLIWTICNDFPDDAEGYHVASKSAEYAQDVRAIALAIRNDDTEELNILVERLDRRPFI